MLDHYRTPFPLSERPLTATAKKSYGKLYFAKVEGRKTENGEGDTCRPTGGGRVCWELLRPCWQWCAYRCNNSKQCYDLQCIVGRVWPITLETMCNASVWLQQCWKSCANGSKIVALRFDDHETKEMLRDVGSKVWPVSNFAHAQPHATRCTNGCNMYHLTMLGVVGQGSCVLLHRALLGKKEGKNG